MDSFPWTKVRISHPQGDLKKIISIDRRLAYSSHTIDLQESYVLL